MRVLVNRDAPVWTFVPILITLYIWKPITICWPINLFPNLYIYIYTRVRACDESRFVSVCVCVWWVQVCECVCVYVMSPGLCVCVCDESRFVSVCVWWVQVCEWVCVWWVQVCECVCWCMSVSCVSSSQCTWRRTHTLSLSVSLCCSFASRGDVRAVRL